MGQGQWSGSTYDARTAAKRAAGQDQFTYNQTQSSLPPSQRKVHDSMDPKLVAGDKSPHAGQIMRECMITDEHPDPTPIAVFFDQTGSMGSIPRVLQQKLAALHGLLVRKGYASDPQVMFGAIGDARNNERGPLQVGQFESDNRMDENLENIYLEGNGGGQGHETYELGLYFLDRHTYLEPFEKQGKKGYAFFIGDERAYPKVDHRIVKNYIGDNLAESLDTKDLVKSLEERYHVYFLFAKQGSYAEDYTLGSPGEDTQGTAYKSYSWRQLLGERAIPLDDAAAVCEVIAGIVGILETGVTIDDAVADFEEVGSSKSTAQAAGRALATVAAGSSPVARGTGNLPGLDEE